jgi:hypothetical protein
MVEEENIHSGIQQAIACEIFSSLLLGDRHIYL